MEKCHNKNKKLLFCLIDFRKYFDIIPKTNIWKRLDEIKFPLELRVVMTRFYENFISNFSTMKGWLEEIKFNIRVKQGCPLSLTLFGLYIDVS